MVTNRILRLVLASCLILPLALASGFAGETAKERRQRHDNLVEALNATSERRKGALDAIYGELRGPSRREMQETLREALLRSNSLILQGAVEAFAMLGDPDDIAAIEALLATSPGLEVKTAVIRLLPAFCIAGSERSRFSFIRYAAGYSRHADPAVLAPLRRPPLTRRGRLDAARDATERRVAAILTRQLDPVGAAMVYLGDRLYGPAARGTVQHYLGGSLGSDPLRWPGIWADQGAGMPVLHPDEIEEIRLAVLQAFSDMETEPAPETLAALRRLLDAEEGDVVRQAAFDAMTAMCRGAFTDYGAVAGMRFETGGADAAENWRRRRAISGVELAVFVSERAGDALRFTDDDGVFSAVTRCLGEALAYPDNYPDPEGRLAAARERGLELLTGLLLRPDLPREPRSAVMAALGAIGSGTAVASIAGIIDSPYVSPDAGPGAPRLAEAAIEALAAAAVGGHSGAGRARARLLGLLADPRVYPPPRPDSPPLGIAHMALWRLQRLARSTEISFEPGFWRDRLGW